MTAFSGTYVEAIRQALFDAMEADPASAAWARTSAPTAAPSGPRKVCWNASARIG